MTADGPLFGRGIATFVEPGGIVPRVPGPDGTIGDQATVTVGADGKVTVAVGTSGHGQGHETAFAQLAADLLGVPYDDVTVVFGDTDTAPFGYGTFGSRSIAAGGTAIHQACQAVLDAARRVDAPMPVAEAAARLGGISANGSSGAPQETYASGAYGCDVAVDPDTGAVTLLRVVAVDDCGVLVNPLLVEGQVHGAVAQGVGQALTEQVSYDENGQPMSASLMDYAVPFAATLPRIESYSVVTPSTVNPLGVKGMGESGTIGVTPALVNAVMDALVPLRRPPPGHAADRGEGLDGDQGDPALGHNADMVEALRYVLFYESGDLSLAAENFPSHKARYTEFMQRGVLLSLGPFSDGSGSIAVFSTREAADEFVAGRPVRTARRGRLVADPRMAPSNPLNPTASTAAAQTPPPPPPPRSTPTAPAPARRPGTTPTAPADDHEGLMALPRHQPFTTPKSFTKNRLMVRMRQVTGGSTSPPAPDRAWLRRSAAQAEAPRGVAEAGGLQGPGERRVVGDHAAVGLLDRDPAERAVAHGPGQGLGARLERGQVLGPGQQRLAAALDVQHEFAVEQHHDRARLPAGPVPGRGLLRTGRPRQRRAVRLRRVGRGEHHRPPGLLVAARAVPARAG